MKKPVAVTIITCESGDWEGLYVDGVLYTEGHSIRLHEFVDLVREYKNFSNIKWYHISDVHMEWLGNSLPVKLEDVNYSV